MSTAQIETPPTKPTTIGRRIARGVLILGAILLLFVGGVLAIAATKPDDMHIERTATINAPPDAVFAIINDLHRWPEWSPYDRYDPQMNKVYKGAESGPGAIYEWNGNANVGEGRLTITKSTPSELVTMKLEFTRPFNCTNEVNFKLQPSGDGTQVSWVMDGKNTMMSKVMCVFMSMDKMVGSDFEVGLANLDKIAQK